MTKEQYNQAEVYIFELDKCEKIIKAMEQSAAASEADITFSGNNAYARVCIGNAALIKGLVEYIKAWYTNRKTELETLLSEI